MSKYAREHSNRANECGLGPPPTAEKIMLSITVNNIFSLMTALKIGVHLIHQKIW